MDYGETVNMVAPPLACCAVVAAAARLSVVALVLPVAELDAVVLVPVLLWVVTSSERTYCLEI